MAAGTPLDLPTIAGFGCVIAAVALTWWAAGDVRDAFAEEFGDWPQVPDINPAAPDERRP